ncbi:hydroxymethylbilane synthase [Ahniella affigens]|uniref:Porphobilinogen deaminase n=2 Tax=Ahniella affigens TaxID=2021234 RepID=A0A2P1PMV5_9GAMM|nr:hydroxymethylbilane synthase [Ahniella affigens]
MTLTIATRQSPLALWQTEFVADQLRALHPGLEVRLLPMSTRGDLILDRSLAAIGGKGLFLKELEEAMLAGQADLAVHSMKDVPMTLPEGFELAAILERADPFDAWVSNRYPRFADLPVGAVVGTSSLRRQVQLRSVRPDLVLKDLRGNVNTRLRKLDDEEYDGIVLAVAGLARLGFDDRVAERLTPPRMLPAVAQGAIGIEIQSARADLRALLAPLGHDLTTRCVLAERAMNRLLEGNCQVPIAGHAAVVGDQLHLAGLVGALATQTVIRAEATGALDAPEMLGERVAQDLLAQGAAALLRSAH